jgi:putative phosphoribosyl transferase
VASAVAEKRVAKLADRVVACTVGYMPRFYVSDFYRHWHDVMDEDVVRYLNEWHIQQLRTAGR